MQKFASFIALIFIAACATTQTALTESLPILTSTIAPSATNLAYPPPANPYNTPAYPVVQLTEPPIVTPFSPPTGTPTPFNPTPPPLIAKVQLEALTLFNMDTGWALQSFYTPSTTEYLYDVERKILRTTEGFQGWRDVSPPNPEMNELRKVFFLDGNTAVGFFYRNFMPFQAETELTGFRTVDGGRTWQIGEMMHFTCCLRSPIQMEMLDANHGWMYATDDGSMGASSLAFFRTTDGGLRWEKVYDSNEQNQIDPQKTMFSLQNPFGSSGFALLDFNTALYVTGFLYHSEDGGKSWQRSTLPIPPAAPDLQTRMGISEPSITIPQFWTKQDGVMVGRYYTELEIPPSIPKGLPASEFLYYSHDGGKSWTFSRSPVRTGSPFFLDSNTGWYLGKSDPDPATSTQLYQTTDGGQTWAQILSDCPLPLGSEIHFIDARIGYALMTRYTYDYLFDVRANTRPPYFLFTHDSGHTWEQVEPGVTR